MLQRAEETLRFFAPGRFIWHVREGTERGMALHAAGYSFIPLFKWTRFRPGVSQKHENPPAFPQGRSPVQSNAMPFSDADKESFPPDLSCKCRGAPLRTETAFSIHEGKCHDNVLQNGYAFLRRFLQQAWYWEEKRSDAIWSHLLVVLHIRIA